MVQNSHNTYNNNKKNKKSCIHNKQKRKKKTPSGFNKAQKNERIFSLHTYIHTYYCYKIKCTLRVLWDIITMVLNRKNK